MTTYTVALPKGGSSKTATAAEIAWYLAACGRRVLAIDLDQQGNLTTRLGISRDTEVDATAADVLTGEADVDRAAVPAGTAPGVWVVAGTHDLTRVEAAPPADLVTSLRDHLPTVHGWDDIVIDTPPSITGLSLAGLAAADVVVAPVASAAESYDQLGRLERVLTAQLGRRVRPGLRIDWVVPALYDARRLLDREILELLGEHYPGRVTLPIREAVAVKDAYTAGMTISAYAPTSAVAGDCRRVMEQITGMTP